jgi:UDP-GlcNAc:undecaprenyl-phosphate GlcNAc-1-phosphate transferase
MSAGLARLLAAAATTALATAVLARLAPRLGWTDAPRAADAARKRQRRPVPAVGGVGILAGLLWTPEALLARPAGELWGGLLPAPAWGLATLFLALAAGTWDDRAPLGAGRKTLVLLLALAPLAAGAWLEHGPSAGLALLALGFLALNLLNTFDNADGALAGLCALGFAGAAAPVSAACLGVLPSNLDAARARNRASGAPSAYLGDAGAFALGVLVLLHPQSAGVLVLPLLDLLRLSLVRWRAGSRPWRGDRRHLAHRLAARGLARPRVALVQCALAAPACALGWLALERDEALLAGLGVLATAALFALALRAAPEQSASPPPAVPCPPPGRPE